MTLPTSIAIYFLIWWLMLFAVLPCGVRSQHEGGDMVPGTDPGAPVIPRLWWKLLWTTILSGDRLCDPLSSSTRTSSSRSKT